MAILVDLGRWAVMYVALAPFVILALAGVIAAAKGGGSGNAG
jgi:hypothetical protein